MKVWAAANAMYASADRWDRCGLHALLVNLGCSTLYAATWITVRLTQTLPPGLAGMWLYSFAVLLVAAPVSFVWGLWHVVDGRRGAGAISVMLAIANPICCFVGLIGAMSGP